MAESIALCSHCGLPSGLRPSMRRVNGVEAIFCCYGCALAFQVRHGSFEESEATWDLVRLGVGAFFAMNIMLLSLLLYSGALDTGNDGFRHVVHVVLWLLATPAVTILGWPFVYDAWQDIRASRVGASSLVVTGVGAAYGYSAFIVVSGGTDVYFDTTTMVLVLFTLGRYIEAVGRARAARDLAPMLEAEMQWVTRVETGRDIRCAVASLSPGDRIRVAAGERIAVDGVVLAGRARVDEAVISGESRPIAKQLGDHITAGSIALDGTLLVHCAAAGSATQWGRICQGVRRALADRSPLTGVADRLAAIFVPVVLAIAATTVVVAAQSLPFDAALLRGLAVLVVACPCALGLAAPLAMAFGMTRLAHQGCLVRDGRAIERLARVRTMVFDKTGTLTSGMARFVALATQTSSSDEVLRRAAGLEQHVGHSFARAVVAAASRRYLVSTIPVDVRVEFGRGVVGVVDGEVSAIGAADWLVELGLAADTNLDAKARVFSRNGYSIAFVGWAGQIRAVLAFDDEPQPQAHDAIAALRRLGLRALVLSGDQAEATQRIAEAVGADGWEAKILPEGKAEFVARLRRNNGPVGFVGDGLNDGLALSAADAGIAVGTATDLARETASIVLPSTGIALLPAMISLARSVRRQIMANLAWAFAYNFVAIALAAGGWLRPIFAAALMAGSSLLIVANSLRLERSTGFDRARSHQP